MRKILNAVLNFKNWHRLLLMVIVSLFVISCNDLPADLQARKIDCIKANELLIAREDTIKMDWEYEKIIVDYTKLNEDIISYTADCNKRGISKNNDELIKGIKYRIVTFQKKLKEKEEKPNYGYSSSSTSSSNKTCSWCGKSFSGTHYTHLGKISECYSTDSSTSIGIYCSMKCCSEARRSTCPTCR
jgi:hypothetical protein